MSGRLYRRSLLERFSILETWNILHKETTMIALYHKWVFQANESSYRSKMWNFHVDRPQVHFLQKWEGDNKSFLKEFRKRYPNESIRVFRDNRRPVPKLLRHNIEHFMETDSEFKTMMRDEKIHELLDIF
jgi:hypothetical protein